MRGLLVRWLLGTTLCVGMLTSVLCPQSGQVYAQATAEVEEKVLTGAKLLPEKTMFYMSVPSIPEFVSQWKAGSGGKLLADPKFQPFIEDVTKAIDGKAGEVEGQLGVSLADLLKLAEGEITIAISEAPVGKLAAVMLFDFGENEATINTLLEKLDGALESAGGKLAKQTEGEIDLQVYSFPKDPSGNPFNTFAYFVSEGYLVAGSEVALLKNVIERWDGEGEKTLEDNATFKYIYEKCGGNDETPPVAEWYVDLMGLVRVGINMAKQQMPQAQLAQQFMEPLGLTKLKGMGGTVQMNVDGMEGYSRSFVMVDTPTNGIMNMFQFPAVSQAPPGWIPANVGMYAGMNWDVETAYSAVEELVDMFQGPGALERIVDSLAEDEDGPKVHIKKDIIDQLNGQIHVANASDSDPANPFASFMVALGLKDPKSTQAILTKAAKSEGFTGKTRQFEGATLYEFESDGVEGQSLTVTVADGALIFAGKAEIAESALRGKSGRVASLVDSKEYKELAAKFPAKTSWISFQQPEAQIKPIWDLVKSQDPSETLGIDFSKLPDFEAVQKYLRPSAGYMIPDAKGALQVNFSPGLED